MRLSFHGAARGVTGSCHLVECAGTRILIDCGMYQGGRELDEENAEPFGFEPSSIDVVLLTHAHLDHCGRLPLLVKRGFRGEIVTTAASRELARVVMLDSGHLQEEEAHHHARRSARHGSRSQAQPLYTAMDALHAMEHFGRTARYGERLDLAPGLAATFYDAGHILGSASVRLELAEGDHSRSLVFSGDLGNAGRPLLRDPVPPPHADLMVLETTYGDRLHKPIGPSVAELHEVVETTIARGGNVVIPTFALERAQELLYYLREGVESGRLPRRLPVYLDSPMAVSATEIFERHAEALAPAIGARLRAGHDPFHLPGLRFVRETADSIALNRLEGGAVIMAGSGMCTGGRVRHHLRHNLWREESSVVLVGYASHGTLARKLVDGAKTVRIFGEDIRVRAAIHTINGFSAHADRDELLAWHAAVAPDRTFLVHGEEDVMTAFAKVLPGHPPRMPTLGECFEL
ncbi:MBL fold metallo-hydrolase [Burkholderiaceae bacterium FT117]|uniref:MBL fold metallo-hydrolase RNA specificity domain-containing protein n=1 Tax=Zeimonas sediminis TaxID=2944268 RepID=UPI0023430E72|nr:MBL fold metallo-hydrolase [Zeimonas sediminis]MCM5569445.1 MBL fold metallo-hydrolase [Zeimonas sediminis]